MSAIIDFFSNLKILWMAATAKPVQSEDRISFPHIVEINAAENPGNPALICEGENLTWSMLNQRVNNLAVQLQEQGIGAGDCVSLFMQNRTEFVICSLAATKLGAVVGMINSNLSSKPLAHCIRLIDSKKCIFGEELTEALSQVKNELDLKEGLDYLFVRDPMSDEPASHVPDWAIEINSTHPDYSSAAPVSAAQLGAGNKAFYIFTSGTTGLPKAAVLTHKRLLTIGNMSAKMVLRLKPEDRMYNCLPLYHGTGLMVGLTAAFLSGASTVVRRKFSASAFWADIRQHDCTAFVYIGELIRYLMSRPADPKDAQNKVRTIIGNGLRPDIWMDFKKRFDIERIGEFYGASEGNGGFANVFNKDCTVGLGVAPAILASYDVAADEIRRDENGFCMEVKEGDPGLLLIEITEKSAFEGYTSNDESEKKILRDAFKAGDCYFNTGDLMKTVDVGFAFGQKHYQFVDRVGDTFRWKGENVSTNEVGEIINQSEEVSFTNVYGVEIPGADGRAGMAAIVLKENANSIAEIDLAGLSAHIQAHLPSYARPIFLRIQKEMPTTSTLKLQKNTLKDEAFHPDRVEDELLVMKPGDTVYSQLDTGYYAKIQRGEVSF